MNQLSRRRFFRISGVAAAVWMLKPSTAWAAGRALTNDRSSLPDPESPLHGLVDYIDAHDGLASLLDGDFRVLRMTPSLRALLRYDPAEVNGKSRYFSLEMQAIIDSIGGPRGFQRLGICRVDYTAVRRLGEGGLGNAEPPVPTGRMVAIGNPCAPMAYLTTLRLGRAAQ
jgi:hypothetical protein